MLRRSTFLALAVWLLAIGNRPAAADALPLVPEIGSADSAILRQGQAIRITAPKPKTVGLPSALTAFVNPTTGSTYKTTDLFGNQQISVIAILDTGASGNVLSASTSGSGGLLSGGFNLPKTGETYLDEGIGGFESFNVSTPIQLMLAPLGLDEIAAQQISNYTDAGEIRFQIRHADPIVQGFPVAVDIIGTPVLNQHVMHVQPNSVLSTSLIPFVEHVQTTLLPALPENLPNHRVTIPVDYVDFVDQTNGPPPVTVSTNPVIRNVQVMDGRHQPSSQSAPRDWVFDSGGSVTVISNEYARDIGIDLENETPVSDVTVSGVGNETRTFFGYRVDELIIPLTGGNQLIYEDPVFFVGDLPANLPAIFGMNLIGRSFSQVGLLGPTDTIDSPISDWYLDPVASEITFVGAGLEISPTFSSWANDVSGDWNDENNWSPHGIPSQPIFGEAITSATTVFSNIPVTVSTIRFDNTNPYILAGMGTIHLDGLESSASIHVDRGEHQFQTALSIHTEVDIHVESDSSLSSNNLLSLNGNQLNKYGEGTLALNNKILADGATISIFEGKLSIASAFNGNVINHSGTVSPGHALFTSEFSDGANREGSLTLVPEPAAWMLALSGWILFSALLIPWTTRQRRS